MAEPVSVAASVLAVITAAVQSTRSLCDTVRRFKDRNNTLSRLLAELEDLVRILDSLHQAAEAENSVLELLQGPIKRCNQVCQEFEQSMKGYSAKSGTSILDWAKLEFKRGNINEFIDTISGYKSTISVGVGTIILRHTSKVSQRFIREHNELIQDTAYSLELHKQRIDERMKSFTAENTNSNASINLDLDDEKEVTKQCLRICEDAGSYLESVIKRESVLLPDVRQGPGEDATRDRFEAQMLTRRALDGNRDGFIQIINRLQKRLESLVVDGDSGNGNERLQLQEDINSTKHCLELCKVASEVSREKVCRIGEVIADGDSDQVVVNTLADLFDIGKSVSRNNSAQLVGVMTDDALKHVVDRRYSSRFGAVAGSTNSAEVEPSGFPSAFDNTTSLSQSQTGANHRSSGSKLGSGRPSPNEIRKRMTGGVTESSSLNE